MEKLAMEKLAILALFAAFLLGAILTEYRVIFGILSAATLIGYFVVGAKQVLAGDQAFAESYASRMRASAHGKKPPVQKSESDESSKSEDKQELEKPAQ